MHTTQKQFQDLEINDTVTGVKFSDSNVLKTIRVLTEPKTVTANLMECDVITTAGTQTTWTSNKTCTFKVKL